MTDGKPSPLWTITFPPIPADPWTALHTAIARRYENFLKICEPSERATFEAQLVVLLNEQAARVGYERAVQTDVTTEQYWIPIATHSETSPSASDVQILATGLEEVHRPHLWASLRSINRNELLGLLCVLSILGARAEQFRNTRSLLKIEEIFASQALQIGYATVRGFNTFGGNRSYAAGVSKLGTDEELQTVANRFLANGTLHHRLVAAIMEKYPSTFGVRDHVRRRLKGLGILHPRKKK